MANLSKMAQAATQSKPTIPVKVTEDKDGYTVRIPKTVGADAVREKSDEKGTRFGMTLVCVGPNGAPAADLEIGVTEGDKTSVAKFGLGVVNLQFHGFKA